MEPIGERSYDLRGRHLAIAMPSMDGRMPLRMAAELLRLLPILAKHGVDLSFHQVSSNALINSARNMLAAAFLTDERCTDMLFLDSDIVIKAEDVVRLLCHTTEKEFVGATYRKKIDELAFHGRLLGEVDEATGLLRADRVPGGCVMVRRAVFEKLMPVFADFKYESDKISEEGLQFDNKYLYDFFSIMVVDRRLVGEDYMFSLRFHSIGGEVWLDPMISLTHIGQKDYEGRFADFLEASKHGDQRHAARHDI